MLQVTQVWEEAKSRLGFSLESADHTEQLGGQQGKGGGNSLCVDTPGSGGRRRLGPRERAGEAPGDLLSLSHLALGTCSAVPTPSMGCPGLTSESLAGGQEAGGGS